MKNEHVRPREITINLQEGNPPSLNPYVGVDLRSRCLFLALFEPLMRRNANGKLEFAAASSVDIDPTRTIYTFHIRPHQWSNGEPVTSRHFAQAWRYALTPGTYCIRADLFYPIKHAEKVKKGQLPLEALKISTPDDKTLVVELELPIPYFLDLTATSFFSPLYRAANEEPTCFNGPFLLSEWTPDLKMVFQKNPSYWDSSSVQLERINFSMVKDPTTALAMYEQGELDVVGDPFSSLPFDSIPAYEQSGQLKSKLISRIFYLLLNAKAPLFHNKSLRKALGLSIDRNQLTEHIFYGELSALSLLPKTLSRIDDETFEQKSEDPVLLFEQALRELNLTKDEFPKLIFSYAELSGQKQLAEFIQDQWKKKLGIEIEIQSFLWNSHVANLRTRNYQIGTFHFTTIYQDPMFYFEFFKDKDSLCNYTGWEHPNFQRLVEQSDKIIDQEVRSAHLQQAELELFEEMPAIPLFTQNLQYLVQDHLDLMITDLGIYDFKQTRFKPVPIP